MDLPQRQGRAGQARSASAGKTFVNEQRSDRYRDSTSLGTVGHRERSPVMYHVARLRDGRHRCHLGPTLAPHLASGAAACR